MERKECLLMEMMSEVNLESKQLAQYFKAKPEYARLLKGIKNKYISLGEIKGNVIINNPDKSEKQLLSGLMKKDYSSNKTISINLQTLQQRIDNSKFCGASLKGMIYEYFKEEIITKKECKGQYEIELEEFFKDIINENIDTLIYSYLKEIISTKNDIFHKWKKYYNKDKRELKIALINACKGINNLPKQKMSIPAFASNLTGNPHLLDKNTLCGKVFIMLMCYIKKIKLPQNSEELAEIYYNNNLLIDDVSNMVLCKNITGFIEDEEIIKDNQKTIKYIQHSGLCGFANNNEPIYLNLYNLSNIAFLSENGKYKKVVVMENPTVFMEVFQRCKRKDFPLICTYGQVKLSALILLDMLVDKKYKIYYSGDIDPEGIGIADRLKNRYKQNLYFLGFDLKTYKHNLSNVELSEERLKKLNKIKSDDLQQICRELRVIKKASYEEKNINEIINFIDNTI